MSATTAKTGMHRDRAAIRNSSSLRFVSLTWSVNERYRSSRVNPDVSSRARRARAEQHDLHA